jgi:hypothetical protein
MTPMKEQNKNNMMSRYPRDQPMASAAALRHDRRGDKPDGPSEELDSCASRARR